MLEKKSSRKDSFNLIKSKKKLSTSLSLSRKEKLNEKIINEKEILRNEKMNNEAKAFFMEIGIEEKINIWNENCKFWIFHILVNEIVNENFLNIYEIDQHLKTNFGKSLQEYDYISTESAKEKTMRNYSKITLDELIKISEFSKQSGFCLEIKNSVHSEENKKIKNFLIFLIERRKKLDQIIHINNLESEDNR